MSNKCKHAHHIERRAAMPLSHPGPPPFTTYTQTHTQAVIAQFTPVLDTS